MKEPRDYTLLQAAQALRAGAFKAEELVRSCLEQIAKRDERVRAWVVLTADEALKRARKQDAEAAQGRWQGILHGIPLGIKDIYDVAGTPTRAGTAAHEAATPSTDSTAVALLKAAGGLILGKTETTAYAFGDPAPTRNPWNLERTPGGSSAGSGAAVADRMCLGALGSQTVGSVLRPASFNGLVGFKPGFGKIDLKGVIPLSWSQDHVGTLTRDVADTMVLWQLLRKQPDGAREKAARSEPVSPQATAPARLWRVRGFFEEEATPESLRATDETCRRLAEAGVSIVEAALPFEIQGMWEQARCLLVAEAAAFHEANYIRKKALYPPVIGEGVAEGLRVSGMALARALQHRRHLKEAFAEILNGVDGAIMPTTVEPAPTPETTGNRRFQLPWSYTGLPAVTLPVELSRDGLPLGVQLVSAPQREDALLQRALWCEQKLGWEQSPPQN